MPTLRFFDADLRPPRSGWRATLDGQVFGNGLSESDAFQARKKFLKNNGKFISDLDIERELWSYWGAREPERLPLGNKVEPMNDGNRPKRDLNPKIWGPWVWTFMNFAAVKFNKTFFIGFCRYLLLAIDCPDCKAEWADIMQNDGPDNLDSAYEACVWTLRQHNRVSAKLGKPQRSYQWLVAEFGAPLPPA